MLGAFLASHADDALEEAIEMLRPAPVYTSPGWLSNAMAVRKRFPPRSGDDEDFPSVGVPTWHYGHEPSNVFARRIAKFFDLPTRESSLVQVAEKGMVFFPGSAGTFSEIFTAVSDNHYKILRNEVSPLVFYDSDGFWSHAEPSVIPLLRNLARGREYAHFIFASDAPSEVVATLEAYEVAKSVAAAEGSVVTKVQSPRVGSTSSS